MFLNRAGVQNSYSHKVRLGNWSEEQELEELRMKEFIHRKEKGQLLVHRVQQHMNSALQEVGLSYCPDGVLHIGDHIMLYSVSTSGVLSVDPSDRVSGSSDRAFAVSTSTLVKAHVARNTFVIEAYGDAREAPVGSVLRLGQQFRLRLNPVLLDGQAYYLQSQPVSSMAASKVSHKQLVCMSSVKSFDTVWRAQWKSIAQRFEMEGQPAPANAEVVLLHAATNTALSSALEHPYSNDFGLEYEVAAHSHIDIRKSQGLYSELQGKTTTDIPFRKESAPNHWAFLTAASEERAEPLKRQQQQQQQQQGASAAAASASSGGAQQQRLNNVLLNVREDLLTRGAEHLFSLLRSARALDAPRAGYLSYDDFRKVLLQHGLRLSLQDFDSLCRLLDSANDKHVNYMAFLASVHGPLAPAREGVVQGTFDALAGTALASGRVAGNSAHTVALATLQSCFDGGADPEVSLGRRGAAQAKESWMVRFRALSQGARVSREDFVALYAIHSAFVESDDYFVDWVSRSWKVPAAGPQAAAAASSARH